jgi:NAD(P)-dependent dehydrogenase (short-subunit alcohol dehydrogenase family)
MLSAADRVVAITGGGQGLGAATARCFVDAGWKCVLLDVEMKPALELQDELGASSILQVMRCDVTSTREVDGAFARVAADLGRIDCVVNNAGIVRPSPSDQIADQDWLYLMDVHLGGTMRVCRAALGVLVQSQSPSIVNLSSICAARGFPGRLSYNSAKAGIEALTRTLSTEWGALGVRVNAVAPGFILTPNSQALYEAGVADAESRAERTSLGRLGMPSEVAEAVYWLASDRASYVTGQVLVVDGGFLTDGRTGRDSTQRDREVLLSAARARIEEPPRTL